MATYEITSDQNEKLKWIRTLWTSRGIRKNEACLVFGSKIVKELLNSTGIQILFEGREIPKSMEVDEFRTADQSSSSSSSSNPRHPLLLFSKVLFQEIDKMGTHSPFLVVKVPPIQSWRPPPHSGPENTETGIQVVCPFSDPLNLGAVIRSGVAFGVQQFVLTEECAHPFHPRCIRSSAGAVFSARFAAAADLTTICRELETHPGSVALDMEGESLPDFRWKKNTILICGEEGQGLPEDCRVHRLSIPIQSTESLNAMVATSIALFDYRVRTTSAEKAGLKK